MKRVDIVWDKQIEISSAVMAIDNSPSTTHIKHIQKMVYRISQQALNSIFYFWSVFLINVGLSEVPRGILVHFLNSHPELEGINFKKWTW